MLQFLFGATLFVAAALLFWVQLFTSKMVLPVLGGSAAVWNTCLVFFQLALLAGYLYAYAAARWLSAWVRTAIHPVLLLAGALALPVSLHGIAAPPADGEPAIWLLRTLVIVVGVPFLVLAGTAPLLQEWFSRTRDPGARDPYFLYAASNCGSLFALVSYPALVEPRLALIEQTRWWTGGYLLLTALAAACGVAAGLRRAKDEPAPSLALPGLAEEEADTPIGWGLRARWLVLAFVPSSLLLGVTTHLTTDVAAAPLFWVVPLTLYLLTFILAFQQRIRIGTRASKRLQALLLVTLAVTLLAGRESDAVPLFLLHLATFLVTALLCHTELARSRPAATHLTQFYLVVAAGGALGGSFNALAAPLLFPDVWEYPLVLVLACFLRPGRQPSPTGIAAAAGDFALPALVLLALLGLRLGARLDFSDTESAWTLIATMLAALAVFGFQHRPVRFGLGVAALLLSAGLVDQGGRLLLETRNFYGVLRVVAESNPPQHVLYHGTTTHGTQSLDPAKRLMPLSYYHPDGPLGAIFKSVGGTRLTRRVGLVGLGAGTIACYGHPGEQWTFFEINPKVVAIARNPSFFTFLRDCPAKPDVILGDARLSIAMQPDQSFDMLIFDAFNSDAIPIHLMTREAVRLYLSKLRPGGLLVFHISNRYLDLAPVLGNVAASEGLAGRRWNDNAGDSDDGDDTEDPLKDDSDWVVLARDAKDLGGATAEGDWEDLPQNPRRGVWTDDYSNLLGALIR